MTSSRAGAAPLSLATTARFQQRRRWIRRTLVLLVPSIVALIALATWMRDNRVVALLIQEMRPAAQGLQKTYDATGALPAMPDALPPQTQYLDHAGRFYAQRTDQPVIVAYHPARFSYGLYLHANGRAVVILDDGLVHVEWLGEKAFQQRLRLQTEHMREFERQLLEKPLDLP